MEDVALYAYTAGFFDGEGHISLTKNGSAKGAALRIGLTNTDITSLADLRQRWNNIGRLRIRASKGTWKPRADWRMGGLEAREFLKKIRPYLTIKATRADVILGLAHISLGKNHTEETAAAYAVALQQLSTMNKRGIQCQA